MGVLDGLPAELRPVLDELDPAALERCRQFDATLQGGHPHRYPDDTRLKPLAVDDAGWRAMALWTQLTLRTTDGSMPSFAVLESLTRRKLGWSARERELLWRTTLAAPNSGHLYQLPVSAIKDLPAAELGPLLPHIRRAKRELDQVPYADLWPATRTLDLLLSEHPTGEPGEASRCLVPECDGFAALVRGEYGERLESPEVLPMLRHWVTATSSDPAPKWTAKARGLLTPGAVALAGEILGRLPAYRESPWNTGYRDEVTYLQQRTAELARGMVWTCELTDEPWVTGLLGDVAVATGTGMGGSGPNSRSERVANAALGALSRRGGLEVVPQLARVQAKVRKKSILAKVARTLDAVAVRTGLSPEQLLERTVPTFGLSPDGTRAEQGLALSLNGTVTFDGRRTIPKTVDRDLLAEFKATAKELEKAIPAERFRVERALASERLWRWDEVCEFYLDHPVTGFFSRALIWEVLQGPAGLPVRVDGGWELTDPAGRRIQPRPDTPVLLWHPISHTADEVRAWRDHLMAIGLRQPYKQAFREIYLLTPAEERTRDRSLRFSRHLLRYGQAKALLTGRGLDRHEPGPLGRRGRIRLVHRHQGAARRPDRRLGLPP
ncbi:DUF4132 domain-containing protein [Nonomuraea dietziae]|uniref:DUF4132 domain-containing protein n=1 Tax=Nonomuraea dietziae TaxID=65515 RepID=A0A7W5UWJ7_9ACTN|nr:DUF4132 domain-containing protein [Nonomuraea dietziae]MBB3726046.1 hypothetical protein [Nonomuraea dietziae]